jgi:RimJ/RimL family protein N-acetyltransferase
VSAEPEISTPRLTLRPFAAEDLPAFVAYRADPEVARWQSWDAGYDLATGRAFLARQEGLRVGAPGVWVQRAVVDRDGGALLGDVASCLGAHQPATAELGVTLAPAARGCGIASEALAALVDTLVADHGAHRVVAETDDRNVRVHRLLDALGLRCEARLVEADWFKGEWTTLRIYAVLAREWRARA